MGDPMAVDQGQGDLSEAADTREAPWTVTEFFLDPRRYNPSAEILHKAANVSSLHFKFTHVYTCRQHFCHVDLVLPCARPPLHRPRRLLECNLDPLLSFLQREGAEKMGPRLGSIAVFSFRFSIFFFPT